MQLLLTNAKINTRSQEFLDIIDVAAGILILKNGIYCRIIEIKPVNFALLNPEEQAFLIRKFSAFLNSLDFPIQIVIENRKLVMQEYLIYLENKIREGHLNQQMLAYFEIYKQFVDNILTQKTVYDKRFYIAIKHFQSTWNPKAPPDIKKQLLEVAHQQLLPKVQHVLNNFKQMGLDAKVLDTPEIVKTFYRYYNPEKKTVNIANKEISL